MDERTAFEHWASDFGQGFIELQRSGEGYRLTPVQTYWEAWKSLQACAQTDSVLTNTR